MSVITILSRLVNGVQRNVDLSTNTLKVDKLQALSEVWIGSDAVHTVLDKVTLDSLIAHDHAAMSDNQNVVAGNGLTGGGSGATTTLNVGAGNGIEVTADAIAVKVDTVGGANLAKAINVSENGVALKIDGSTIAHSESNGWITVGTSLTNTNIAGTANIAYSKLAVLTADRAIVSDNGGHLVVSTVTSTELGHLSGVTSAIQTQLDGKVDETITVNGQALSANVTLTKSDVGLGNVTNDAQLKVADLSTDGTLAANSTTLVPSQSAVKSYADTKVAQTTTVNGYALSSNVTLDKDDIGLSNVTNDAQLPLAGGTMTGALTLSGAPTADLHAATKGYVDSVAQGLDIHQEITIKLDPSDLPAFTATGANATKTLTADANGALGTLQGHVMAVNDSIMVIDSPSTVDDGIYYVHALGDGSNPWVLKRRAAEDGSPSNEVKPGDFFFVGAGTFASTGWVVTEAGDIDADGEIDIDNGDKFTVAQFSGAGTYSADGNGIESSGGVFTIELDGTTLSKSANGLKVNSIADAQIASGAAISLSKLASGSAGQIIVLDGSGAPAYVTPSGDVSISQSGALTIGADKVTNTMLAGLISDSKLMTITAENKVSGSAVQLQANKGIEDAGGLGLKLDGSTLAVDSAGLKVNSIADAQIASGAAIAVSKLASGTAGQIIVVNSSGVATYAAVTGDITISDTGVAAIGSGKVTNTMLDGSIDDSKLSTITTAGKVAGSAVQLAAGKGLKDASGLAIEPSNIAGLGLEDDGSDKLQVKLAANSGLVLDANGLAVAGGNSTIMDAGEAYAADTTFAVRFAMSGETAGRVHKADIDASLLDKFYVVGFVQPAEGVAAGEQVSVQSFGSLTLSPIGDTNFAAGDIGKPVFLTSSGGFTTVAPTAVGDAVVRIGMVQAVNKIWISAAQTIGVN